MIMEPIHGNLFADKSQAILNPVNCVGVAGKGLALTFKKHYPQNNQAYEQACRDGKLTPGQVFVFELPAHFRHVGGKTRYIINFPTKRHWRDKSNVEDIEQSLHALVRALNEHQIEQVSIPALGCGLGGLSYKEDLYPLVEKILNPTALPHTRVLLHPPRGESPVHSNPIEVPSARETSFRP